MVLPIVAAGYVVPAATALYRLDASSITVWRNAPILCFMLARSLSVLGNGSGSGEAQDEKFKLQITRERSRNMFAKADLPWVGLVHHSALAVSAAIHLANVYFHGIRLSLVFGGSDAAQAALGLYKYEGLVFTLSSLLLALGAAPWNLRLCGYITTAQALRSASAIIVSIFALGPAATLAGMASYREGVLASFGR